MANKMAHVAEYKKKTLNYLVKLIKEYPIVGAVNMENLPAQQLQAMRAQLRNKVVLAMTKRRLMKLALEKSKDEKKGIEKLEESLKGMPALIFTKDSHFKLSKILQKNKSSAPARAGQTATRDIMVNKGSTGFAPGPIIAELGMVGIKTGVEGGKVSIRDDTIIVREGEQIKPKVAEILTRLGITPMEVGLDLMAAYEDGIIYSRDILSIDDKEYMQRLNNAVRNAFNLAFDIAYTTNENIPLLIGKAFNDSKALGLSQKIFDGGIVEELLARAERSMLSLKDTAKLEVREKAAVEKTEEKVEEKPKTEVKEEKKETHEKKAIKKEHQKVEEIKEEKPKIEEKAADVDKKVGEMVKKTREFIEGKKATAEDILEEVKEQSKAEKKNESEEKEEEMSIAHGFLKKKEEKEQEEIEGLAKELVKKGTLRK